MQLDLEQLISSAEGFPVNPGVSPGSAAARKMTAISGLRCAELLPMSGLSGSLAKMCRGLMMSVSWASTACYLTWRDSATKQRRLKFRLVPSMPRTAEVDCGLLPTPDSSLAMFPASIQAAKVRKNQAGLRQSKMGSSIAWCDTFLNEHRETGGELNPEWIEVLMGFPIGWTALKASETPSSPKSSSK